MEKLKELRKDLYNFYYKLTLESPPQSDYKLSKTFKKLSYGLSVGGGTLGGLALYGIINNLPSPYDLGIVSTLFLLMGNTFYQNHRVIEVIGRKKEGHIDKKEIENASKSLRMGEVSHFATIGLCCSYLSYLFPFTLPFWLFWSITLYLTYEGLYRSLSDYLKSEIKE